MPNPVSSPNSSYYDPQAQFTPAGAGEVDAVAAASELAAPREVTIPPVVITGDAGARQLVERYDAARPLPDCSLEGENAALSCGKAGLAVAGALAATPTVVGTVFAAANAFVDGISCGRDLRAYYDCETQ